MSKVYITITGMKHYCGTDFLKPGMKVKLRKEKDNVYDKEAIKVVLEGLGTIGYVANSTHTVVGECYSAGRVYDKIGKKAHAKIMYVSENAVVCKICKKSLLKKNTVKCEKGAKEETAKENDKGAEMKQEFETLGDLLLSIESAPMEIEKKED